MKAFITILICKLIHFIGSAVGRGSSLPGQIALKICPDILNRVKLTDSIIAVTGSNGKTSTVEMIAHVLSSAGKSFAYNKEGSNQIEGVTSLILCNCSLKGVFKKDILLIESDERYAKYTFGFIKPTYYVITNLYRDQLTRNGHPLWVFDAIKPSIPSGCKLFLNSDDPLVSLFSSENSNTVFFGMEKQSFSTDENTGIFEDGKYCPVCSRAMQYSFRHYNHIGSYSCSCGYSRAVPNFAVTEADLDNGFLTINNSYKIPLAFKSIYNAYNILACFSLCSSLEISEQLICESIGNYVLKNGRVVDFMIGKTHGTLLTSKHENSVSYDQSIKYITMQKTPHAVVVIVDSISRKYFTSDTSWLWDINFDMLSSDSTEHIYLLGKYAYDLAVRFSFTDIDQSKISVLPEIEDALEIIASAMHEKIYAVTCFSDKDKLLSRVTKL